jgi:hypothetical protein
LDNLQNILNQLQQHQQSPPDWCFDAVVQNFSAQQDDGVAGVFEKLKTYSSTPPPQSFDQIFNKISNNNKENISQIGILKNYAVQPPQHSFENILKKINNQVKTTQQPATVISFLKKYSVAAACVGLLCAGIVVYTLRTAGTPNDNNTPVANNSSMPNTTAIANESLEDTVASGSNTTIPSNAFKNNIAKRFATKKSRLKTAGGKEEIEQFVPFSMNGINIPFEDNDFMATFINYKYSEKDSAMFNIPEGQALVIRLDQYNYVSISSKMQGNMKTMYKTKNNGDPTRKAKKMKKKLEAWKNDDKDNFDKKVYKNPLDPLDLFDFLYKKKIIIEADSADVMEEDDEK